MPNDIPYMGYDRAGLDGQYNNREMVADHQEIAGRWARDGADVRAQATSQLDISFGPSPAEVLDVFIPEGSGPFPINVFLHGGYWYSRHKDDFSVIANTFLPAGAISVIVNYALVPEVPLAELVRQCRAAVAWTHANVAQFGGDAERLYVTGHSAGGHLVAMMLATDWSTFAGGPADLLKGGLAISGIFDLTPMRLCYLDDHLHLTTEDIKTLSPLTLDPKVPAPLIAAYGGAESDEFHRQAATLAEAWRNKDAQVLELEIEDANHFTILDELMTPGSALNRVQLGQMGL